MTKQVAMKSKPHGTVPCPTTHKIRNDEGINVVRNDAGINVPSCERLEVLADYFENKQLGQIMSEEQKEAQVK